MYMCVYGVYNTIFSPNYALLQCANNKPRGCVTCRNLMHLPEILLDEIFKEIFRNIKIEP